MRKKLRRGFLPFLCLLLLCIFCGGAAAAEAPYYADEEAATNDNTPFLLNPFAGISPLAESDGNLVVVIDPGHGGGDGGAQSSAKTAERDLNLKVAQYCKAYLEKYDNVTVYLTRTDNTSKNLELSQRTAFAADHGADIMMSVHFNSGGGQGGEAYTSLLEEYELKNFATAIVNNLSDLGIKNRGVKTRASENGTYWYDGKRLADYYGIITDPAKREIPSIIVEHCFIDNEKEYNAFASNDEKLKKLGEADAKAIVSAFHLDENISASALTEKKTAALAALDKQYNAMDLTKYSETMQSRINAVYNDAKSRVESATGSGKIDVTVNRAVKTLINYPYALENETPFLDVKTSDWFWPAVSYCVDNKLFYGTSETTFSPQTSITRGMFIAVIGRMAGVEEKTPCETKFSDVSPGQYYAPHIKWATDSGIVAGLSETSYGPDAPIRREDLIRMLHNYCTVKNISLPDNSDKTIADFKDDSSVDSWAKDAMNWSIAKGIIHGNDNGKLNPRNPATRAEVAQIMMMFRTAATEEK